MLYEALNDIVLVVERGISLSKMSQVELGSSQTRTGGRRYPVV